MVYSQAGHRGKEVYVIYPIKVVSKAGECGPIHIKEYHDAGILRSYEGEVKYEVRQSKDYDVWFNLIKVTEQPKRPVFK